MDAKKRSYNLKTSHPTYLELAAIIGAGPKRRGGSVSNATNATTAVQQNIAGLSSSSDEEVDGARPLPLRLTDLQEYNNR